MKGTIVFVNFELQNVPLTLFRHFIAWYKLRGLSRRDLILGFMREKIASDGPIAEDKRPHREANKYIFVVTRVPRDLHQQFNAWCALHGVKQKDVICACIKRRIKNAIFNGE